MTLVLGLISLVILVYSAILHEIAHGFIAERLGDPTARLMGRLTLDPRSHIDLYMTILLPILTYYSSGGSLIFGGAKPVPVDPFNFRDVRKDTALVSLAGPGTNILVAMVFAIVCHFAYPGLTLLAITSTGILGFILGSIVLINILLAIFNLIPIPPLDGSKIFALILPEKEAAVYLSVGTFGMMILFFLLLVPVGGFSLGSFIFSLLTFSEKLLGL